MRIISGKYKGHRLVSFDADHLRPTTDRVKESQFNILREAVLDVRVLDLFCGTGNLGLEALSRGAESVLFVDMSEKSLAIVRQNVEKLKIPKDQYQIQKKDALQFLKNYEGEAFGLILIDPPFTKKMAHEVMEALGSSKAYGDLTVITIESEKKERIEDQYGELFRFDAREFGDKTLSFYSKKVLD